MEPWFLLGIDWRPPPVPHQVGLSRIAVFFIQVCEPRLTGEQANKMRSSSAGQPNCDRSDPSTFGALYRLQASHRPHRIRRGIYAKLNISRLFRLPTTGLPPYLPVSQPNSVYFVCLCVFLLAKRPVLVSFPVSVIKYPNKSNLQETGFIWLLIQGTVHPRWEDLEAVGLITSTSGNRMVNMCVKLAFFLF